MSSSVDSGTNANATNWLSAIAILVFGGGVCALVVWSGTSLETSNQNANNGTPRPTETQQDDEKLLDEDMRQFLWDIEHIAFEMEQKVLPQIKQALTEPNRELFKRYLADGFSAQVPPADWVEIVATPLIRIKRQKVVQAELQDVTADNFVDRMLSYRDLLDSNTALGCKSKIGLVRLGPVEKTSLDGPWEGLWRIRLWGERNGLPAEMVMDLAVDLDPLQGNVDAQTHFIRFATLKSVELRTCTQQSLKDVTADSGINVNELYDYWRVSGQFKGSSGGVYLSDYDQDGNIDALIDDAIAGTILYRGLGDCKFELANQKANIPRDAGFSHGACWADLDNDGDDDLICASRLFSNDGDGTFTEVTEKTNLQVSAYSGLAIADFDGDGLVDIYESHGHSPSTKQRKETGNQLPSKKPPSWIDGGWGFHNVLWRNLGKWKFEDVTEQADAADAGGTAFSSIWFDANDDMWPDILAINEFGCNSLLINKQDGTFRRTTIDPVFGGWSMGVIAGDYDNDGHSDVFIANMYSKAGNRVISNVDPTRYPPDIYKKIFDGTLGNKLYRSKGNGRFDVVPYDPVFASIGWTYGNVFVDYNGDGHLDLYATAGFKSEKKGKPDG